MGGWREGGLSILVPAFLDPPPLLLTWLGSLSRHASAVVNRLRSLLVVRALELGLWLLGCGRVAREAAGQEGLVTLTPQKLELKDRVRLELALTSSCEGGFNLRWSAICNRALSERTGTGNMDGPVVW